MPSQLGIERFNVGLLGDKSAALSIYKTGLKQCENAITEVLGPVKKRGGFQFLSSAGTIGDGLDHILFPFVYNNQESYVLLASSDRLAIFDPKKDIFVEYKYWPDFKSGYHMDVDKITMYQVQDVVYICGARYKETGLSAPLKLTRLDKSGKNWSLEPIVFKDGPWLPENDTDITVSCSVAATDGTTKTGTSAVLTFSALPSNWDKIITETQVRLFAISGTNSAWSWFKVTSVDTANKKLNCTYGGGTTWANVPSKIWRLSACLKGSQPTCCTIFEGRMCYAWDKYVFLSKSQAYNNFAPTNAVGTVANSDAITALINMKQSSSIQWIATDKNLLVGTDNEEYAIKADDYGSALTPTNVNAQQQSTVGSAALPVTSVGRGIIAVKKFNKKATFFAYSSDNYSYNSQDLSIYNTDVTEPGIIDTAYTSDPDPILWYVLDDGSLVGQTLQIKDDVMSFHHHTTYNSNPKETNRYKGFKSITSIPDSETGESVLYALVCRHGNVLNLERLNNGITTQKSTADDGIYYADCWIKLHSDTPQTHWEQKTDTYDPKTFWPYVKGESMVILADGAVQPDVIMQMTDDGTYIKSFDIQYPAKDVVIGYRYDMVVQPTEVGVQGIVLDSRVKNVYNIYPRLYKTVGVMVGTTNNNLEEIPFRSTADKMDEPVPLYTGLRKIPLQGGWNKTGSIVIAHNQPLPFCMLALYFDINVGG
nr:MAG TPA: stabilization protein [Caudoviricetes sp.]